MTQLWIADVAAAGSFAAASALHPGSVVGMAHN